MFRRELFKVAEPMGLGGVIEPLRRKDLLSSIKSVVYKDDEEDNLATQLTNNKCRGYPAFVQGIINQPVCEVTSNSEGHCYRSGKILSKIK